MTGSYWTILFFFKKITLVLLLNVFFGLIAGLQYYLVFQCKRILIEKLFFGL